MLRNLEQNFILVMSKAIVFFNYADRVFKYNSKTKLKQAVLELFKIEKKPLETINYIFCSDEYLLKINQQFLNHDTYTDIITFPHSSKGQPVEGEIYISIDRVKENAKRLGTGFESELLRVVFHGALHLCDYDDKTAKEKLKMRSKEDEYIKRLIKM